jgi:hypothetical protein
MATNTLGGVNLTRISQLTLDALITEGIPLSAFTTDFSGDALPHGEVITTRFVTVPSTQNFNTSKATGNSTTTARNITMNQYRGVSIGFKDTELAYTDIDLKEKFILPSISVIVDEMIAYALALTTTANGFNSLDLVSLAADFDADDVADLAQRMSTAKVPKAPRNLILKPTYHAAIAKSASVQDASSYASADPIRENRVPRLHGFNVIEYNGTIPTHQGMEGIALHPQALCIAARTVPIPPAGTWYGKIQNVVDPNSGLTIQVREHYDGAELVYQFGVLYGAQIGIPGKAARIINVAP